MAEDPLKQKEELIRLIADVEQEANKLESLGQGLVESARLTQDVAEPLVRLFRQVPPNQMPPEGWARQIEGWEALHDSATSIQAMQTNVSAFSAMTASTASMSVTGVLGIFGRLAPAPPPSVTGVMGMSSGFPAPPPAEMESFFRILERQPLAEKATASMQRLGLDRRGGNLRSPLDLLNEARGAMERPVVRSGGPVSVLISLRECIDAVITEHLRRRPKQESATSWSGKVISVGSQCAGPSLPANHFDGLGADAKTLMDQLSGAKQADMDRDRLMWFFIQGLLFLNALMESIDEGKLKPV